MIVNAVFSISFHIKNPLSGSFFAILLFAIRIVNIRQNKTL
nr:MAG TPA: hypothetical protein [Caudoviricetes sp.]